MNRQVLLGVFWTMVAPALTYLLIEHTWYVRTEGQVLLISFLCLGGGLIYFIPRS